MAPTHARRVPAESADVHDARPWSADEHERFLAALEKYGCGQSTSVFAAWHAIAATVATRSVQDVKAHARRYYAQLQVVNAQKRKEFLAMQQIDARWTMDEDARLEDELASHIPTSVSYPWKAIARRVPGKTPRDARERYVKLCYDISRIESGQHVMMHLGRHPGHRHGGARDVQPHEEEEDPKAIDCIVALTPQETQIVLGALERVPVPPHATPDVLAALASAVAALASSRTKIPPKRASPLFSSDDACHALQMAIDDELSDPFDVLELLAHELDLLPPAGLEGAPTHQQPRELSAPASSNLRLRMSSHTSAPSPPTTAESLFLHSPTESVERDESRAGEELLTHLRTSPVHGHLVSAERRRLRVSHFDAADGSSFPFPPHASSSFPYSLMPTATRGYPSPSQARGARRRSDYPIDDFL